mmetsp:Transcript_24036/g.75293  ORF Transcript_24036/g.75293 Transcript_24036/m.75293 type:complete len:316 (+) Transcript_24036:477-1424(+)
MEISYASLSGGARPASSARDHTHRTFLSPSFSTVLSRKSTRFRSVSSSVIDHVGRAMAMIIPGSPPPVPTSMIVVPSPTARASRAGRSARESSGGTSGSSKWGWLLPGGGVQPGTLRRAAARGRTNMPVVCIVLVPDGGQVDHRVVVEEDVDVLVHLPEGGRGPTLVRPTPSSVHRPPAQRAHLLLLLRYKAAVQLPRGSLARDAAQVAGRRGRRPPPPPGCARGRQRQGKTGQLLPGSPPGHPGGGGGCGVGVRAAAAHRPQEHAPPGPGGVGGAEDRRNQRHPALGKRCGAIKKAINKLQRCRGNTQHHEPFD